MGLRYRSILGRSVHYLLYATVGFLLLEALLGESGAEIGTRAGSTSEALAIVVTVAFAVLAVVRYWSRDHDADRDHDRETDHDDHDRDVERESEPPPDSSVTNAPATGDAHSVRLVLVGLLVVGAVLRLYALGEGSLWFDEAVSANAAIALGERGRPTFPSGATYWRALPHTIVVAGSMALFGTGAAAARFPSVVFGVATIGATYWLGREVGGPRVGLLAAALVTVATWEIAWSRQARMYQQFQLLYTLSLVCLLRVERTWFADRRVVLTLVTVAPLAAATHQLGWVLAPVSVAYLGFAGARTGRLEVTPQTAGGFLGGAIAFAIAFELVGVGFSKVVETLATDVSYWDAYVDWLRAEFHAFVALGVIGSTLTFYCGRYRTATLLVLAVGPVFWLVGFHAPQFATRYLYVGVPVLFVWASVTLEYVARRLDRSWGTRIDHRLGSIPRLEFEPIVAFSLALLLALGGGFTVVPQAGHEYELGPNAPQPDFEGAYAHVNDERTGDDVIVAGWTAPGLYYAGGVDYWLAHDLTGRGDDYTVNGTERYAGATPVRDAATLETVIDAHERGWIVVDEIALARQDDETTALLADEATLEYERDGVTVYSWGRSGSEFGSRPDSRSTSESDTESDGESRSTSESTFRSES